MYKIDKKIAKFVEYWVPVILWALVIFNFSSISVGKASDFYLKEFVIKKTAHFIEYGIFAALNYRALKKYGFNKGRLILYTILITVLYSITDEFHQSFTPGREPSLRDVTIDIFSSSVIVYFINKFDIL